MYTDAVGRVFAAGYPASRTVISGTSLTASAPLAEASWSADGTKVSFVQVDAREQLHIAVGDTVTGVVDDLGLLSKNETVPVLSADGMSVAVVDGYHVIDFRSSGDPSPHRVRLPSGGDAEFNALSLSADAQVLAVGLLDGGLFVVNRLSGESFVVGDANWHVHAGGFVSPNGKCVAVFGSVDDGPLSLYVISIDSRSAVKLCEVATPGLRAADATWSSDGHFLVTVVSDPTSTKPVGTLVSVDAASGRCTKIAGTFAPVPPAIVLGTDTVMAASADGKSLAAYSSDGTPLGNVAVQAPPHSIGYRPGAVA